MPNENIKRLHENLTEKWEGFNVPYEQFEQDMQDDEKRERLRANLEEKWEGFTVPAEQFKADMSLKKKEDEEVSEVSGEVSISPEKEQVSISTTEEKPSKEKGTALKAVEKARAKARQKVPSEYQKVTDLIVERSTAGIKDPKRQRIQQEVMRQVEDKWNPEVGTPARRMVEYTEAAKPLSDKYLDDIGIGKYPTTEQRDAYVKEMTELADSYGLDLDENLVPKMRKQDAKMYKDSIERTYDALSDDIKGKTEDPFMNDFVDKMAAGAHNLYANTVDAMGWALALNAIPGYKDLAEGQRFREAQVRENISRKDLEIMSNIQEGNYGKALGNTVLNVGESVPVLLSLAMGNASGFGNATLGYLATTTGTGRYRELEDSDLGEAGKIFNSVIYGLSEALPEKFGTSAAINASLGALKRGVGKDQVRNIIEQTYRSQLDKSMSNLMGYTNTAVRGGIDEVITEIGQNYADMLESGEMFDPLQGAGDAFIIGMFTDVAMTSPKIAIDSKETATELVREMMDRLPTDMNLGDKAKAMEIMMEKAEDISETENLDEAFAGTKQDKQEVLNSSLRLAVQEPTVKEKVNELNNAINEELGKKYPDTAVLSELETELDNIDKKVELAAGKELTEIDNTINEIKQEREDLYQDVGSELELQQKSEQEKEINTRLKDALIEKQKIRNEVYGRALGDIDSDLNKSVNQQAKQEAQQDVENIRNKAVEQQEVQQKIEEAQVEEKLAETAQIEVEPKIEKDERKDQRQKVREDEYRETRQDEGVRKREEKEVLKEEAAPEVEAEGVAKIFERPEMENPVSRVVIGGKERFIQRREGLGTADAGWFEVRKDKDGVWQNVEVGKEVEGFPIGYTKKEAIEKFKTEPSAEEIRAEAETPSPEEGVEGQEGERVRIRNYEESSKLEAPKRKEAIQKEVEKKVGKIEQLEEKRREAVQRGMDRLSNLGNLQFALSQGQRKQAIEDMAMAAIDFGTAGVISLEIGGRKAVDYVLERMKAVNPGAEKFIEDNRAEIEARFDEEVTKMKAKEKPKKEAPKKKAEPKKEEPKKKASPKKKPTPKKEPVMKEMRLGQKALESADLPESVKQDIRDRGILYAVRGKEVRKAEADEIVRLYSEGKGIRDLKEVIMDMNNDINLDTRTHLAVSFMEDALNRSYEAKTEGERLALEKDANDMFDLGLQISNRAGRDLQAQTEWGRVVGEHPSLLVNRMKQDNRAANEEVLKTREEDIRTSKQVIEDFLNSQEFKNIVESRTKQKMDDLLERAKTSKQRKERGKAKVADGMSKLATAIGAKINLVNENEVNEDVFEALKEIADGLLDIGVSSVDQLINKMKMQTREYLVPSQIDKIRDQLVDETEANTRLDKPPTQKQILTPAEVKALSDKLYGRMIGSTKKQTRKLVRDYADRFVEGGALDNAAYRDLFAQSLGMDEITPEVEAELRGYADEMADARKVGNNLQKLFKEYIRDSKEGKDTTKIRKVINEQTDIYNKALKKAAKAGDKISRLFSDPKTTADLLATFIKGNLLTPISLATNVYANALWLPARGAKYAAASGMDAMASGVGMVRDRILKKLGDKSPYLRRILSKLPDAERTYSMTGSAKGYTIGFQEGIMEGLEQMVTGLTKEDIFSKDIAQALKPMKAGIEAFQMLTPKEKFKTMDFINKTIEATLGVTPEIMFRLLNLGDKPFRRAAEKARLYEIADINKLKGAEREAFLRFPPDSAVEEARQAGLEATYQQDNKVADFINSLRGRQKTKAKESLTAFDKLMRGVMRVLEASQIPFVKTPTNIMKETLEYSFPAITALRGLNDMYKGNRRKALDNMSKALVGSMLNAMIWSLLENNIMTLAQAGLEEEEEGKQKVKMAEYRDKNAYRINPDALMRYYFKGESPEWEYGDRTWEYKRFGIISSMMMAKANVIRGMKQEEIEKMNQLDKMAKSFLPIFQANLDQSFLSGVNAGLTALLKGGQHLDRAFTTTARALSASAIPNTYATVKQYQDEYIRETRARAVDKSERWKQELKNTFKSLYTTPNGLPAKVTVWGEDVKRVPDGRGVGYVLFDITKSKEYQDNFGLKIFELYERTRNRDVLMNQVSNKMKFEGENITLSEDLYYDLQKRVGQKRKQIVQPFVESSTWDALSDDEKTFELEILYDEASAENTSIKQDFIDANYEKLRELADKQRKD